MILADTGKGEQLLPVGNGDGADSPRVGDGVLRLERWFTEDRTQYAK